MHSDTNTDILIGDKTITRIIVNTSPTINNHKTVSPQQLFAKSLKLCIIPHLPLIVQHNLLPYLEEQEARPEKKEKNI